MGEELHRETAVSTSQAILERLVIEDLDLSEVTTDPAGARKRQSAIRCLD
jgi:hypothetical protein